MTDKPTNDGGPAFPAFVQDGTIREEVDMDTRSVTEYPGGKQHPGMSLRDYFAAKAMQAIITATLGDFRGSQVDFDNAIIKTAKQSFQLADAMMKVRER